MERGCGTKRLEGLAIFGSEQFIRGMWSISLSREHGQGRYQWTSLKKNTKEYKVSGQHESLLKDFVEQVKISADTDCNAQMMRHAYNAHTVGL